MKRDDSVYLRHIIDAIHKTESYILNINEPTFHAKTLIQDGVIRQIEIMGEATKRLSVELRKKHTNIPWDDIAGMRDKLIHDYFGVDIEKVWLTATEDLPSLKEKILLVLKQFEN